MSLRHILKQGQIDWVEQTGDPFTYLSVKTGRIIQVRATTEVEVEVIDNDGLTVRHPVCSLSSTAIPEVTLGDVLTNKATGEKWTVQEVYEDDGVFKMLYINEA
jgi:hypothetical protein